MKPQKMLCIAMIGALVAAFAVFAVEETGTINGTLAPVMSVTFTPDPLNITLDPTQDFDGTGGVADGTGTYLELSVQSNLDYTVQLSCDGNLHLVGLSHWRNTIETEYAIWKKITWHDYYTQQPLGPGSPATEFPATYFGWVQGDDCVTPGPFAWYAYPATPVWFNAETNTSGKQGGHGEQYDFSFDGGYLPEHYDGASWGDIPWYQDTYYNYGADLTLRFFPYLDMYSDYGTIAGSYTGTITVVITNVATQ